MKGAATCACAWLPDRTWRCRAVEARAAVGARPDLRGAVAFGTSRARALPECRRRRAGTAAAAGAAIAQAAGSNATPEDAVRGVRGGRAASHAATQTSRA